MPQRQLAPIENRTLHGIVLMLVAMLGFTGIDTCAKWLVLGGVPPLEVVFMRYFGHLLLVLAIATSSGESFVRTGNAWPVLLRGTFLLGSTVLNFTALRYLPLTTTAAIFFSGPLWICLLSIPLLGEEVGPRRWIAMFFGFLGVLVVTRPWAGPMHPAMLLSIGAALCGALYSILTRMLAGRDGATTQQFYAGLVATVSMAPLALPGWVWPSGVASWFAFFAIGVIGWGAHQILITAHRFAPASTLAPVGYTQMLYMIASSWIIFAQPPDGWVLAGAAIVAASGLYIWLRERALARNPL